MNNTEIFEAHRRSLVGAAYRILSSVADAEDVVQETWLRWSAVDRDEVADPRAYLFRITTRLALNRIRQQQRLREEYVGPWLPEPLTDLHTAGADESTELAESISMAMLVVLQSLSPAERAAFVMREVFDFDYSQIAGTLDRSEPAVRQLVHRAKAHVQKRSPRHPVDPNQHRAVTDQLIAAFAGGSLPQLVSLMAPDVVLYTDGGGVKQAALKPIYGADRIARFLLGIRAKNGTGDLLPILVNGEPGIAGLIAGDLDTVGLVELDGGLITNLFLIRNPEKLGAINL